MEAIARYERAVMLAIGAGQALAFVQPEIVAIPVDTLHAFMAEPALAPYRHLLDDLDRQRPHVRSAEVEEVLAQFADVARAPAEAFSALDDADLDLGMVHDDDGREIKLTEGRYLRLMESRNRDVRAESYAAMSRAYQNHAYTLTSLYGSSVRKDVVSARIRGHESARSEALFDNAIPVSVYDSLITAVSGATSTLERFLALRRRALGLDDLQQWDLRVPLAPEPPRRYEYREAVEIVLSGLGALGERYTSDLGNGFASRWVDVHETKNKRSGAYSWGVYGSPPVMLMNWSGTLTDVLTLAHEAGHAMHTFYASASQPFHDASYPIFLAEIASTVNEVLLTWSLLEREEGQDPVTRFSLLNRFADGFYATVITQAMYAEFEQRTHAAAEEGMPLTLDFLNDTWGELFTKYTPGVGLGDGDSVRIRWSRIPHFYRAFYVYQYATGMSAAINIARAVRDEGDPARERYLAMLGAGGSDYPLDILKRAGVDLTTPEPVRVALEEFAQTISEMERLAEQGVFNTAAADT
jgi:oligoendopeptidase F